MTQGEPAGFAAAVPRWWSVAAQWLGWRPDEFWNATPGELRGALADPQGSTGSEGPSMELITEMLEREKNG